MIRLPLHPGILAGLVDGLGDHILGVGIPSLTEFGAAHAHDSDFVFEASHHTYS